MRSINKILVIISLAAAVFSFNFYLAAADADIVGTWKGTSQLSITEDPNDITMIIEKGEKGYSGNITDSFGYLNETPMENIELNSDTLRFTFYVEDEGVIINNIIIVDKDEMEGELEGGGGEVTGTYSLKREKK